MKQNRFLITVTNNSIKELKVKNINFLFPIKDYTVGFTNTYSINEIDVNNSYIYINRILDKEAIEKLKILLKQIPPNIIGICFTDLGIISLVKKLNLSIQLIYMQNHNTTNYLSINYYLEEMDSLLVSTDITRDELYNIFDKANKPLVVPYFMLVETMYSRRKLLTNFQEKFKLNKKSRDLLKEPISKNEFLAIENDFGTVLYDKKYIDYRELDHENILFYYINPIDLTKEEVEKIINKENIDILSTDGFFNKKTYYNLKEEER